MVFVNLKRQQAQQQVRRAGPAMPERKCMNCGSVLDNAVSGIDGRRFCSSECKEQYMGFK